MGRKRNPGLIRRDGIWHIDKRARGRRLCESTGERSLEKAEFYLARRIDEVRHAEVFGDRPDRSLAKRQRCFYWRTSTSAALVMMRCTFECSCPFIGDLSLRAVHRGSLQSFVDGRRKQGVKTNTINMALKSVRHTLNLAASEWLDENGLTWLERAPKISTLKVTDARKPYPLSFKEQDRLFKELPAHLARMALFKVNTGCREQEVCPFAGIGRSRSRRWRLRYS